jgi:hypothetical protein
MRCAEREKGEKCVHHSSFEYHQPLNGVRAGICKVLIGLSVRAFSDFNFNCLFLSRWCRKLNGAIELDACFCKILFLKKFQARFRKSDKFLSPNPICADQKFISLVREKLQIDFLCLLKLKRNGKVFRLNH